MVSQGNDRRNYGEGGQSRIVGHGNHRSEGMSRRERRRQPEYPPTPMDEGRDRLVESVRQNANTILIGVRCWLNRSPNIYFRVSKTLQLMA